MMSRYHNKILEQYFYSLYHKQRNASDIILDVQAGHLDINLYNFKNSGQLPRVKQVLGFIRGIYPSSILDIGPGRGALLNHLLSEFSYLDNHCLDIKQSTFEFYQTINQGKNDINNINITAHLGSITNFNPNRKFDVIIASEILEHIEYYNDLQMAVDNIINLTNKFAIITVPSKEDDNIEHYRVINREMFHNLFKNRGLLTFSNVNGHLILKFKKNEKIC